MNNARPEGILDEASLPDGDLEFVGVEERSVFARPGYANRAVNCRFRTRRAATRDGITILPWCLNDGLTPFPDVYGGFVFADPNGVNQYFIIAANGGVYYTRPNTAAKSIPLPAGVTLTRATFKKFIQQNGCIILLRGFSDDGTKLKPLQLKPDADGNPDFFTGFQVITQANQFSASLDAAVNRVTLAEHNLLTGDPFTLAPNGAALPLALVAGKTYFVKDIPNGDQFTFSATPGGAQVTWNTSDTDATVSPVTATLLDGAQPIPEAVDGLGAQNRLLLISGKDAVAASDVGDFTRYVPLQSTFRINQGDAFTLKYLYLFNESTLLFFKDGNVSKATGVTGDLSNAVGPLNVTQAYGIAAPSVADIGTDVFWLSSELRITSLGLTELNKEQGTDQALSDPLLRTFGRINPGAAGAARLAMFDGYLHVALPLDDAQLVADASTDLVKASTGDPFAVYPVTLTVTAGKKYQWRQNAGYTGTSLNNGTETLKGDSDFTAQGTSITLNGPDGDVATDTVLAILADQCNTAVAVYDFQNGAWAGTDEAAGVTHVVDWLKFNYNGKQQLGFIGADGYLHLYADGYEDEKVMPVNPGYTDVLVNDASQFVNGQTLDVTGLVVNLKVDTTAGANHFSAGIYYWGVGPGADAAQNLWQGPGANGGFNPASTEAWLFAFGSVPAQIADGVRFVGTGATAPVVTIGGTVVRNGNYQWAFVDTHEGNEIQPVSITSRLLSRAYPAQRRTDFKRYTVAQLHLAGWNPRYTIATFTQGQNDQQAYITDEQRDYLKFLTPVDAPDWAPSNVADDFHNPNREDYSYPETGLGILLNSGVDFDALQEYTDTVPVSERGIYLQVELTNTQGRLELAGLTLEAQTGEQSAGVSVKS